MRTFINWGILQRIENSPKEYIVQREVSLLNAFLFGYEHLYLCLKNEEQLKKKYTDIPSIDEYARKKYIACNIGNRNFISILSFTSENELDFFHKYLEFLKEYENEYPIQEPVFYILRETPQIEIKEIMTGMRSRYPMYFGNYNISGLRAFLDGYFLCKNEYSIPLTPFDEKVNKFIANIISNSLKLSGEFVTWDRLYRYDRDFSAWGYINDKDAIRILENFWIDLEKFTEEEI